MTYQEFFPLFFSLLVTRIESRFGEVDVDNVREFLDESIEMKELRQRFTPNKGEEMPSHPYDKMADTFLDPIFEEYVIFTKRRMIQ